MNKPPVKTFVFMAALAVAVLAAFFAFRRTPVCSGDGKYMSTPSECQAWGVDAGVCKEAVDKARAVAAAKSPKLDDRFQCEMRFSDCIDAPGGGYVPKPAFCLKSTGKSAEPVEIRYLQYESDRMNRRKTREVRIE
jgi:uncharacterized protein YgiB involved in biofilm formation